MNPIILNRDFQHPADGWYQIEVPGEHPNRESGVVQVIDEQAITSIVNRFNQEADEYQAKRGTPFPGMLIDHEHFKHDPDKETVAYGWLMRLQNRSGIPFGQIRWTNTGKPAIDGGDYRFFSSEYDPKDLQILNRQKPVRVRPLRLDGLTLTNDPNNKGGAPITNRSDKNNFADADAPASNQTTTNQRNKTMKTIATKLGLAAEASEEAILEAVTKIQNRLTTLEPLEAENLKLMNRIKKLDEDGIAALLAERKITDEKIVNRLKPVLATMPNREERIAALDDFGFSGAEAGAGREGTRTQQTTQTKLHNRDTRPPTGGKAEDQKNEAAEKAVATKIMNRAGELKKATPNMTDATAWIMAQREIEGTPENAS